MSGGIYKNWNDDLLHGDGRPVGSPPSGIITDDQIALTKMTEKLATISLESKIKTLRHALEKIRDEDYRGNHPEAHFIAKRALEETE